MKVKGGIFLMLSMIYLLHAATVDGENLSIREQKRWLSGSAPSYNPEQWLLPGQGIELKFKQPVQLVEVAVCWTDQGGEAVGDLYLDDKFAGRREVWIDKDVTLNHDIAVWNIKGSFIRVTLRIERDMARVIAFKVFAKDRSGKLRALSIRPGPAAGRKIRTD